MSTFLSKKINSTLSPLFVKKMTEIGWHTQLHILVSQPYHILVLTKKVLYTKVGLL